MEEKNKEGLGRRKGEERKKKEGKKEGKNAGDGMKRHTKEIDSVWHVKKFDRSKLENQRLTTKCRTTDTRQRLKREKGRG